MITEKLEHDIEVFGGFGYNDDNLQNKKIEEEVEVIEQVIEQVTDEQEVHNETEKGRQKSLFDF